MITGRVGREPAHFLKDVKSVPLGQNQVQKQQVEFALDGHFQAHLAVGRLQSAVTGKAQGIDNTPPDGLIVFDG